MKLCTTHHHACDCRESLFSEMLTLLRDRVDCACSVRQRASGHVSECFMPEVEALIARIEGE